MESTELLVIDVPKYTLGAGLCPRASAARLLHTAPLLCGKESKHGMKIIDISLTGESPSKSFATYPVCALGVLD